MAGTLTIPRAAAVAPRAGGGYNDDVAIPLQVWSPHETRTYPPVPRGRQRPGVDRVSPDRRPHVPVSGCLEDADCVRLRRRHLGGAEDRRRRRQADVVTGRGVVPALLT